MAFAYTPIRFIGKSIVEFGVEVMNSSQGS